MRVFLALHSRRGPIEPSVLSRVEAHAEARLPFGKSAFDGASWRSADHRSAIFAWRNDGRSADTLIAASEDSGATTLAGYVRDGREWLEPAEIGTRLAARRPHDDDVVTGFGGVFSLVRVAGDEPGLKAWTTPTRIVPTYYAISGDLVLVTNRALLASLVLHDVQPRYDLSALASFVNAGYFLNDDTPFENVHLLPPETCLSASAGDVSVRTYVPPAEATSSAGTLDRGSRCDPAYDELSEILLDVVDSQYKQSSEQEFGLSGGKDSRLVLAALLRLGHDFKARTSGYADHPDVIVASALAARFGFDHEIRNPQQGREVFTMDLHARFRDSAFMTEGMLSAWRNASVPQRFSPGVTLSGYGGELLRGGFAKYVKGEHVIRRSNRWLSHKMAKMYLANREFLTHEALQRAERDVDTALNRDRQTLPAADRADRIYLRYRCGRWAAASNIGLAAGQDRAFPLCDARLVRTAYRFTTDLRVQDELLTNILDRLVPELVDIPLADAAWVNRQFNARGVQRIRPLDPPPVTMTGKKRRRDWRRQVGTDLRAFFSEMLFDDSKGDQVFEVIDRDRLRRAFDDNEILESKVARFCWHIASAKSLVGGQYLDATSAGQSPPVEIRVGYAWNEVDRRLIRMFDKLIARSTRGQRAPVIRRQDGSNRAGKQVPGRESLEDRLERVRATCDIPPEMFLKHLRTAEAQLISSTQGQLTVSLADVYDEGRYSSLLESCTTGDVTGIVSGENGTRAATGTGVDLLLAFRASLDR